jgi:hypothetical protein
MRTGQRGAVLITGIVLIVVIAVMVATLGFLYVANLRSSSLHSSSEQAYFAAYSGLERATRAVNSPILAGAVAPDVNRVPCAGLTGNAAVTNVNVVAGKGQFTATGGAAVSPATPVTLNGALTAAATVIPVTTLAALGGYSASGRIMIDRELIDYSGTSNVAAVCGAAPCFVGARRGAAGTTAAAHATGTRVGQFQCNIQSRGGVPDLASPRAVRILSQGTQLQEGWAVGAAGGAGSGQRPWFVRFRESAWTDFGNAAFTQNTQLNSVFMLSNADGWAVGNAFGGAGGGEAIYQWRVTPAPGWIRVGPVGAVPNANLNSVHCLSANSCWAVGNNSGGELMVRWTGGPNWARVGPVAAVPNANLNSVHCLSANSCWAVGNNSGGELMVRWTGGPNWARVGPVGAIPNVNLRSVYCVADNDCWAVGAASGGNAVIARWTGAANWSNGPAAAPAVNAQLNSVFCVSTNDCWAVGNNSAGELILRWAGGPNWTRVAPIAAIPDTNLNSVFCVRGDDCWAVGNASGGAEVIIRWDGTSWTRVPVSGAIANRNLLSVFVIGASQRAPSSRQEVYP